MADHEVHAAANLFPMMGDVEFASLVEDIRLNGQREPIVYWRGQLIDGFLEQSLASVPSDATLTRVVLPATRSRTKMSEESFVSPATRFVAPDWNAT